jgi:undecaprenyl-phosphate galactose phosphotransferase
MSKSDSNTQSQSAQLKEGKSSAVALASLNNINSNAASQTAYSKKTPANKILKSYIYSDIAALAIGLAVAFGCVLVAQRLLASSQGLALPLVTSFNRPVSFLLISAGVITWFSHTGHYRIRMPFWMETQKVIYALGFALLLDGFIQFAAKQDVSRIFLISGWVFASVMILLFRAAIRKQAIKNGNFQIPALLIGGGVTAQQMQTTLKTAPEMGYAITAQLKNLPEAFLQAGSSWKNLCEKYGAQHVLIALDGQDLVGTERILAKLMREPISFSVASPLRHIPVTGMVPQYFLSSNTMLLTHNNGLEQVLPQLVKRSVDILVAGSALLALSPVMLVIAALIRLDGGPALFGHKRLGRGGKIFPCLKFRSMIMGGDEILKKHLEQNPEAAIEWKETQKLQNDPRVTRLGKILRSTSIDELPQLINVLKGDMSLVGPRPIVKDEIAHYHHDILHYYRVRPVFTGLWQVSGRNDVSYAQRVQMDSWYVRNWTLWNDIAIICKTFPAVLKRSGAY